MDAMTTEEDLSSSRKEIMSYEIRTSPLSVRDPILNHISFYVTSV